MLICGQEFDDEIVQRISATVVENGLGLSLRALSMRVL